MGRGSPVETSQPQAAKNNNSPIRMTDGKLKTENRKQKTDKAGEFNNSSAFV